MSGKFGDANFNMQTNLSGHVDQRLVERGDHCVGIKQVAKDGLMQFR